MTDAAAAIATRTALTKERVLRAAVDFADRAGIDALSMRKLGQDLGVEGMALYRHVRGKDALLDGMIDMVVAEIDVPERAAIDVPERAADWKASMHALATAARSVMLRHPWAPAVLVSRPDVGPAALRHIDAVLGILQAGGFSIEMAHHALHVLGSRVFGFTQDPFNDASDPRPDPATATAMAEALAAVYPNVGRLALAASHDGGLGGCDDEFEFAFGLDLILDGLDRRRTS